MNKVMVLNASQHNNGNSINLAKNFLSNHDYQIINLADYHIDQIGQVSVSDQLDLVTNLISSVRQLVITTPIYWSDMPGYLKTFIDRSGNPSASKFNNIKCYLLIQGFEPSDAVQPVTHVVEHWATRNHMQFVGSASNEAEINELQKQL